MINENQMRTFLEAAKCHNFTTAARKLYVTQPTVSKSIAKLELALNTTLFHRMPDKRLIITEKGEAYYQLFETFIDGIDRLMNKEETLDQGKKKIRLAYMSGWSLAESSMNIIPLLKSQYPDTLFELICLDNREMVDCLTSDDSDNEIDLAISLEEPFLAVKGIHYKTVAQVECVVLYSDDFERENGPIESLDDVKNAPFLIPKGDIPYISQSHLLKACTAMNFYPKFKGVRNFETVLAMVNSGMGVAFFDVWDQRSNHLALKNFSLGIRQNIAVAWRPGVSNDIVETLVKLLGD